MFILRAIVDFLSPAEVTRSIGTGCLHVLSYCFNFSLRNLSSREYAVTRERTDAILCFLLVNTRKLKLR